mmetsp:Transcript_25136/g.83864  ORF Transcript_25136/g.83864 Transcript_25136/m.83864 type:complete len:222 (-) Transcript_25136:644-1309(-)
MPVPSNCAPGIPAAAATAEGAKGQGRRSLFLEVVGVVRPTLVGAVPFVEVLLDDDPGSAKESAVAGALGTSVPEVAGRLQLPGFAQHVLHGLVAVGSDAGLLQKLEDPAGAGTVLADPARELCDDRIICRVHGHVHVLREVRTQTGQPPLSQLPRPIPLEAQQDVDTDRRVWAQLPLFEGPEQLRIGHPDQTRHAKRAQPLEPERRLQYVHELVGFEGFRP